MRAAVTAETERTSHAKLQVLEGSLDRVTFINEENGWSVVRVVVPGKTEPITVVGNLLGVKPGESLRLHGTWEHNTKYGDQFEVTAYETLKPATLVGIEKYLGSGAIPGMREEMAARLVKHFGIDTLTVIDEKPERLREVPGIGKKRSDQIRAAWIEQREQRNAMMFLQSHGVSPGHAAKIYQRYGISAVSVVTNNPYRLAIDIFGIGFKTADRIAQALGISADSPQRANAGLLHALSEFSNRGHVYAPREELLVHTGGILGVDTDIIERALMDLAQVEQVVIESGFGDDKSVYSRYLHNAEAGLAELLKKLIDAPIRPISVDPNLAIAWFEAQQKLSLAPEQADALKRAMAAKVLVVTGGPGTGKTTLIKGVISILEKKGRRILLAAPTGRAAKRLFEATGRKAQTIHRMLEFDPHHHGFQRNADNPLEADLVVVDEFSMVDTVLALHVASALPSHCQLLVVGDADQLPSVGPGSVLKDIITSRQVPVVKLNHVFRQAHESAIISNAHLINHGDMPIVKDKGAATDFYFIAREEPDSILTQLKNLLTTHIPSKFGFDPMQEVQVLVPMNRGGLGTGNLNTELQKLMNPSGPSLSRGTRCFRSGDKVMQIRNNYDLGVFNGDIGIVNRINGSNTSLSVTFDGQDVTYEASDLDELVLAYATTVHKSQGSEYPCVVLVLHTQHFPLLQRNLLYTAVTRGRKLVVVLGSQRALEIAVRNGEDRHRYTHLAARLRMDAPVN